MKSSGGIKTGYSLGTLLSIDEILRFSNLANSYENVHSLWVPETWGREAFSTLGAISQVATPPEIRNSNTQHIFTNTFYHRNGGDHS